MLALPAPSVQWDNRLSIDQIYNWRKVHSPNLVTFTFQDDENKKAVITWSQLGMAIDRCVDFIRSHIPQHDLEETLVVGILSTADPITYTTFFMSHLRLTHSSTGQRLLPFLISPRNSAAAVSHLIQLKNVKYLWTTEGPMHALAKESVSLAKEGPSIIICPTYEQLYSAETFEGASSDVDLDVFTPFSLDLPAVILHSSGSTSFPKPVTMSHRILSEWLNILKNGGLDFSNDIFALHSTPLFHMMGVVYIVAAAMLGGYERAVPSPYKPISPWTPERYLENIINSKSTVAISVPSFLEAWSKDPKAIETLKKLRIIFWGGGPLNDSTGRYLVEQGVNIVNGYGTTEIGIVTVIIDKPYVEGHEWMAISPYSELLLKPESNSVFELVVFNTERQHLAVCNTEVNGIPAYATDDLVEQHPDNPSLLRIVGRKGDQIMLSTGEKTNAGPMERIIMQDPRVKCAMLFGRGKFANGVLIEPVSHTELESHGEEKFKDMIWPAIQEANDYGPAHSRILKNMVIFGSPSKPFELTAKNTPRRGLIMIMYENEINNLYDVVESASSNPLPPGFEKIQVWDQLNICRSLKHILGYVTNERPNINYQDDFFTQIGCDSLQALHIRNAVIQLIAQAGRPVDLAKLPQNFVYQYPNIRSLAAFIQNICAPPITLTRSFGVGESETAHTTQLQHYISKYSRNWVLKTLQPEGEVFLVTGTTGSLGSELLVQLIRLPSVSHIYAFNRPSKRTALERHTLALEDSGNDPWLLHSDKITYIHGDLTKDGFGIEPALFKEMLKSVTTIIHNAWKVDFNLTLPSFEPMICGVRKLVDFALSSKIVNRPRFIFISSVSIHKCELSPAFSRDNVGMSFGDWTTVQTVTEAPLNDTRLVNTGGYGESKWVSEQILYRAAQETSLCPLIIRVCQLSGGKEGKWNPKEWFPTLIRTSKKIGCLPDDNSMVSFLPIHVAASAIIELHGISNQFTHLVHPRPIHWREMIGYASEYLKLPVIPHSEWFERVEALSLNNDNPTSTTDNPAIHLLETFRHLVPAGNVAMGLPPREILGLPLYDTTNATANAPSLQAEHLKQLGKDDVEGWLAYWQKLGVLS